MTEEKIINRIKKMMALANDKAASDGERENALRMSYALMARHNLEMSDVDGNPVGAPGSPQGGRNCFLRPPLGFDHLPIRSPPVFLPLLSSGFQ